MRSFIYLFKPTVYTDWQCVKFKALIVRTLSDVRLHVTAFIFNLRYNGIAKVN